MKRHKTTIALANRYITLLFLALAFASPASAQTATPTVRVGVMPIAPFVMEQNGTLTGFSIELWNALAARMKVQTEYQDAPDANSLIEMMRSKKVDLTATPVIVTSARDEEFDFSLPIFQAGLQIMVRDVGDISRPSNPLRDLLTLLLSRTTVVWLAIAALVVLIPAHIVWIFERRYEGGIISDTRYFPGIFEALYWAISCLTAQAETMPHQWLARLLSVFWMFAGVVFVALYTAQLTATLTVQQIQGSINGPEDLPGKQVGTIAGSISVDYLRSQNAQVRAFNQPGEMFQALQDKKVDAVVCNTPVLLYYASHEGKGLVRMVGAEFNIAPVAFLFQLGSPLRKRIDHALLKLREDGTYQQIYGKWFGGQ